MIKTRTACIYTHEHQCYGSKQTTDCTERIECEFPLFWKRFRLNVWECHVECFFECLDVRRVIPHVFFFDTLCTRCCRVVVHLITYIVLVSRVSSVHDIHVCRDTCTEKHIGVFQRKCAFQHHKQHDHCQTQTHTRRDHDACSVHRFFVCVSCVLFNCWN